jgi:hypothetical protein
LSAFSLAGERKVRLLNIVRFAEAREVDAGELLIGLKR